MYSFQSRFKNFFVLLKVRIRKIHHLNVRLVTALSLYLKRFNLLLSTQEKVCFGPLSTWRRLTLIQPLVDINKLRELVPNREVTGRRKASVTIVIGNEFLEFYLMLVLSTCSIFHRCKLFYPRFFLSLSQYL